MRTASLSRSPGQIGKSAPDQKWGALARTSSPRDNPELSMQAACVSTTWTSCQESYPTSPLFSMKRPDTWLTKNKSRKSESESCEANPQSPAFSAPERSTKIPVSLQSEIICLLPETSARCGHTSCHEHPPTAGGSWGLTLETGMIGCCGPDPLRAVTGGFMSRALFCRQSSLLSLLDPWLRWRLCRSPAV